jgi:hypothetical protein
MLRLGRVSKRVLKSRPIRFSLLLAAVLAPSHDLVYLLGYGVANQEHALAESGHGLPWRAIVCATLLGSAAASVLAVQRLTSLRTRLRAIGGVELANPSVRELAARVSRLGAALLLVGLAAFVIQENLEQVALPGGHLPGIAILFDDGLRWAVPVFAILSMLVAVVGSVTVDRLRALTVAIANATTRLLRPTATIPRPADTNRLPWGSPRFAPDLGRAPPLLPT